MINPSGDKCKKRAIFLPRRIVVLIHILLLSDLMMLVCIPLLFPTFVMFRHKQPKLYWNRGRAFIIQGICLEPFLHFSKLVVLICIFASGAPKSIQYKTLTGIMLYSLLVLLPSQPMQKMIRLEVCPNLSSVPSYELSVPTFLPHKEESL